jgi:predicted nucleotide-binding protein
MARINPELLERLQSKLGLSQSRVYALIDQKMRELSVPREVAAIALASERGIGIARFADASQLAEIRQARAGSAAGAITTPPVVRAAPKNVASSRRKATKRNKAPRQRGVATSVFVVHGRNTKARDELFRFLRALSLQPIEWNQAIAMTGEASPYVGTILDTAFREAAAIVVLFTPDDEAKLRKKYQKANDPNYETRLTPQSRPNVLFEAGMAFGRNPDRTVLVQLGDKMRPFSDIGGRHIVHLSNRPETRRELSTKLRNAGCAVNEDGTDWLSEGNLELNLLER